MKKKRSSGIWIVLVAALLGAGALAWGAGPGRWFGEDVNASIEGAPVRRGPLRIAETVRGNLEAKDSVEIKSEVEGSSTILFLVDEGTWVEEGDLVAELDVSSIRDDRVVQEISVQNALASFTKAREQYDIQVLQNESDIALAHQQSEFAKVDLEKYLEGEWPQTRQAAEEAITLKEEELARAEDKLSWTQTLAERGFVQRTELEADEFAVERSKIEYEQAVRERDLEIEYSHPRMLAELKAAVVERERDVLKTEKQARAMLADYEAERASAEARLRLEQETLAKILNQVEKGKMYAPESGMVVYARERSRWGNGDPISEGTEVRERQEIVTIPRPGGMIVEASLHETVLEKIRVGHPCTVVVDAMPGQSFTGRVHFVAVLPDSQSWFSNPNARLYRAEISITNPVREMRPGMSCAVEILSAELEDTLYVPVQSVFLDAGKPICFVRDGARIEARAVQVGLDNSKWVAIEEGLSEGEIVLLSPPAGFTPRATERSPRPEEEIDPELAEGPFPGDGRPAALPAGEMPQGMQQDERRRGGEEGDGARRGPGAPGLGTFPGGRPSGRPSNGEGRSEEAREHGEPRSQRSEGVETEDAATSVGTH